MILTNLTSRLMHFASEALSICFLDAEASTLKHAYFACRIPDAALPHWKRGAGGGSFLSVTASEAWQSQKLKSNQNYC